MTYVDDIGPAAYRQREVWLHFKNILELFLKY